MKLPRCTQGTRERGTRVNCPRGVRTGRIVLPMILGLSLWACGGKKGEGSDPDAATGRDGSSHSDGTVGTDGSPPMGDGALPPDGGPQICDPIQAPEADWFAAPNGQPGAAGTQGDPLDLATLLAASGPVAPGDRVSLAEGIYLGRFLCDVSGAQGAPVVFAAAPGARVILDSNTGGSGDGLTIDGDWVEIHDLEITSSGTDRLELVDGVTFYGSNSKLINCVIHDTSMGVGFWSSAVDSELYGNVIYNNGYEGPTRGHGHAIYTQNSTGTKRIVQNVIFFGFGFGIHAYTEGGSIRGFDILENVWFRAGASRPGSSVGGTSDGCLVGGLQPVARTTLGANHSWGPAVDARSIQLGYGGSVANEDITLVDNYVVGRVAANGSWETGTITGNTFHSSLSGIDPADYPDNVWSGSLPTGSRVVIQRNAYDPGRAHLILYNWDNAESLPVDLSGLLHVGASYTVHSVFDLWGDPVASGVYEGAELDLPMGSVAPPQPTGDSAAITGADDPGRSFGVFVLRSSCALLPAGG